MRTVAKGYLILENGRVFTGELFGAPSEAAGELVFTTGMTGYLETLTDPSYHGQMVVQTFPMIGNYGIIPEDFESGRPRLSAYIVREWCEFPGNFRMQGNLDAFLRQAGIPGLWGLDTRALTKIIRQAGVMKAMLLHEYPENILALQAAMQALPGPKVEEVSVSAPLVDTPQKQAYRVVLMDFGAKGSIRRNLLSRGCQVITVPSGTTAREVLAYQPQGIVLSNGPGDPADNAGIIRQIGELAQSGIPMMGICLGHQLLALARGGRTEKLKYGHRGANQPVKDLLTGHMYITSQNHGYAVCQSPLPTGGRLRFENANDLTCEGIDYTDIPAFSVQFHPEASCGPLDTLPLFDRFLTLMGGEHHAAQS